jgi:c-di-GMP-binding flagellar brake protein YcgR
MPRKRQVVAVVVPTVGRLLGRVDEVGADTVTLSLDPGQSGTMAVLASNDVSLVFASARGLHRLTGSVRRSPLRAGCLSFEPNSQGRLVQRRQHVRIDAVLDVTLFLRSRGGESTHTSTRDISGGGMAVADGHHLSVGEQVGASLDLGDGSNPVFMTCRIVRRDDSRTVSLQIDRIATPERERMIQYIFMRQRMALRIR